MSHRPILCVVAAALGLSACTAGQTGPPPVTSVNPASVGKLQLAVGTANVAGAPGLNVVATYRQANGGSAVLVNTPRLTGPFSLKGIAATTPSGLYGKGDGGLFIQRDPLATADTGPSADEVANNYLGGTPQTSASNPNPGVPTTLGASGGVFGNGFMPGNYTSSGNPYSYNPYYQPFYAGGPGATAFVPLGGPPAFDPNRDGAGVLDGKNAAGVNIRGISLGLAVFAGVTPVNGTYNLSVAIPTAGAPVVTAPAATLANAAKLLPAVAAPGLTFKADNTLNTVTYVIPPGLTGAFVEVIDNNLCGGGLPAAYTFWVTTPGAGTQAISNTLGACAGDPLQTVLIGYNYDAYALQYNGTTGQTYPQAPPLPAGDADVTISPIGPAAPVASGSLRRR